MDITVEFLLEQKHNLEIEKGKAISFIANADGGLAVIEVMLKRINTVETPE